MRFWTLWEIQIINNRIALSISKAPFGVNTPPVSYWNNTLIHISKSYILEFTIYTFTHFLSQTVSERYRANLHSNDLSLSCTIQAQKSSLIHTKKLVSAPSSRAMIRLPFTNLTEAWYLTWRTYKVGKHLLIDTNQSWYRKWTSHMKGIRWIPRILLSKLDYTPIKS